MTHSEANELATAWQVSPGHRNEASIEPLAEEGQTWKHMTYEGTDCGQELRLHCLLFREPAANEDRVVGDLVGNLVCEACEGRRRPDERRRIEGRGHAESGLLSNANVRR